MAAEHEKADASPVDHAKVARLREAIDAGDYVVDPEKLAQHLIDSEVFPHIKPR